METDNFYLAGFLAASTPSPSNRLPILTTRQDPDVLGPLLFDPLAPNFLNLYHYCPVSKTQRITV